MDKAQMLHCLTQFPTGRNYHKDRNTAPKMKFSVKDFFSKCDQIRSFLQIWSYLLRKPLIENFICCAVEASNM